MAERAARLLLSVVVGFVVARYLGPGQFGMLNYAFALATLAMTIAGMGVEAVARREVIESPATAPSILAAVWWMRLAAGASCYAIVLGWAWLGESDSTIRMLVGVAGLLLFQPALAVADLWLQATLRARHAVIAQLLALLIGTAARLALVAARAPLLAFAVVAVCETFLAAILVVLFARREGMFVLFGGVSGFAWRLARESWPLLLSSVAITIYLRIDMVMLQRMAGAEAVGIYTAAVRISEVWYFLPMALASSILPALLRARAAGAPVYSRRLQQYFDGSVALAYGFAIPVALAAPWIIGLTYGSPFLAAGPVLALHIWASAFVFLGVARGQFLVNEKLARFALLASSLGAAANIALNWVMIPRGGAMGAAWATVISYALATWVSSFLHPRVRSVAMMQTRALLLPVTGWRYLHRP